MFLQYSGISSISFIYSSSLMNTLVILLQAHPNKMSLFSTRFAFSKLSWTPQDCLCALTLTSLKLKLPPLGLPPLPDPHYPQTSTPRMRTPLPGAPSHPDRVSCTVFVTFNEYNLTAIRQANTLDSASNMYSYTSINIQSPSMKSRFRCNKDQLQLSQKMK